MSRPSRTVVYGAQVSFALVMLYAEIHLYHVLGFLLDAHTATFAVSISLSGLAVGALVAFSRPPGSMDVPVRVAGPAAALLAGLHGLVVAYVPFPFLFTVILLVPMFACLSYVLSSAYFFAPPGRVVFFELMGASVGGVAVWVVLDHVGLEGGWSVITALCVVAGLLGRWDDLRARRLGRWGWAHLVAAVWLTCGAAIFCATPVAFLSDPVIMERTSDRQMQHMVSLPSFEGRVDAYGRHTPAGPAVAVYINGRLQDHIMQAPEEVWRFDPRLPATLVPEPRIFIIGTSAQGIVQPAIRIPGATVESVELNAAVVELMTDQYHGFSGRAYDHLSVSVDEGRAYVARSAQRWDIITLMNPYPYGSPFVPDYLHTVEALTTYLDHLTERGSVILEEYVVSDVQEARAVKLVATIVEALRARGVERPSDCVLMYVWSPGSNVHPYLHVLFRRTPYTPADLANLDAYFARMTEVTDYGHHWIHRPAKPTDTSVSRYLTSGSIAASLAGFIIEPTTDDRPFPKDVGRGRQDLVHMSVAVLLLFSVLVVAVLVMHRRRLPGSRLLEQIPLTLYFIGSGTGLLLLEFYLIHACQLFVGMPSVSFMVVLTALLVSSSIGGLVSRWFARPERLGAAAVGLVGAVVLIELTRASLFSLASFLGPLPRAGVVGLIALVPGILHGVLFPGMLERIRRMSASRRVMPLYYGVSSIATVLGSVFAIVFSVRAGLRSTGAAVLAAYLLVIVSLLVLRIVQRMTRLTSRGR